MENRRAPSSAVLHQRKHEQPVPAHHVQPTGREIWCRPRTARTRTRLCPYDRPRRNGEPQPPVYTVSHCSPKNYLIEFDKRFDKFGTGSRYYQQIRVHGDTLTMNAYDATTNDLYDAVDLIKDKDGKVRLEDRGKEIPEALIFHSNGSKKEEAFQKRIDEYKQRKGIR